MSDSMEIGKRLNEFLNCEINLVLKDNTVIYGTLQKAGNGTVTIINMRRRRITLTTDSISELYTDLDA